MAYPQAPKLYVSGNPYGSPSSPLEIERGRTFGDDNKYTPQQYTHIDGAGNVSVVSYGRTDRHIRADFGYLSQTQITQLKNFLSDPSVDWKANPFTFVDEWGTEYTVHWWADNLIDKRERNMQKSVQMIFLVVS